MCTSIPDGVDNPAKILVEDKLHELTLSIRHMSEPFPIRGEGRVRIVKPLPFDPGKPDEPLYLTLAETLVPKGLTKALIILNPDPNPNKGSPVFKCRVLDLAEFEGGDYLYLNLSPTNILVVLGKERIPLRPGALRIQRNRGLAGPQNTPLSFFRYEMKEKQWKLIVATTVVVQPTRREICVFKWDPKYKRVDFQGATFPVDPP
ncbi:MAG: hypothetical protein KJO79_09370 [Verrucomicrobiae bacterium]|nr:hypothetical protein [Verrucomicrobiae bacterium]NNJ87378.1 hypothetical protein [Akkermansiaceae bacterium]